MTNQLPPTVQRLGEWQVVTAGGWQISIGPDACIQLPRQVHPADAEGFAEAFTIAQQVALDVFHGNRAAASTDDRAPAPRTALVHQGTPPAGTIRMPVQQRQSDQATIGRPNRRSNKLAPQTALVSRRDRKDRKDTDGTT